jgi:protein-tyrosine-phosphatase
VIFACVHNAGRSQMAAAFFNKLADPAKVRAVSAGTAPGDRVYPEVVAVMQEEGIDLSGARPQKLTAELAAQAQLLITMGCGDECPSSRSRRRLGRPFTMCSSFAQSTSWRVRLVRSSRRSPLGRIDRSRPSARRESRALP